MRLGISTTDYPTEWIVYSSKGSNSFSPYHFQITRGLHISRIILPLFPYIGAPAFHAAGGLSLEVIEHVVYDPC